MWSRRDLVQQGLAAALAAGASPFRSLAAGPRSEISPHFLVYLQIYGAWDVCLAFDPKDRESRLSNGEKAFDQPYAMDEVREAGVHRLAPGGMALAPFADRMAIINGIDMELDAGHTPRIVMTGDVQGPALGKPFLQAIVSERHPYLRTRLIPHLYASYDGFFMGGPYASKTIAIASSDAYKVLYGSKQNGDLRKIAETTRAAAAIYEGLDRQRVGQYAKAIDQAIALQSALKSSEVPVADPVDTVATAQFIGALFRAGVLGSFTWSLGESFSFDTHSAHYATHPLQKALEEIASFCKTLQAIPYDAGTSVFDHTTFVLSGEFSRTPRLNAAEGKDHNFRSNSLVFIGKNVSGGTFGLSGESSRFGAPPDAHTGLPIDLRTGRPAADGVVLKARNVWAGAGRVLGADLSKEFGAATQAIQFLG